MSGATPALQSEKFVLRAWRKGDEDSLVRCANNRKISINLRDGFPFPYTRKDAEEWVRFASNGSPLQRFAIEVDGEAAGGIGFLPGTDVFRLTAELGYWLAEAHWGKGIMTEAVRLATRYAFESLGMVRIHAGAFETNPASARVLEKAGYTFEARMRRSVVKEGRILDQLNYVMIREEA